MSEDALKLLFDVGVGRVVEEWFISEGFDVKTVRSLDPKLLDTHILNLAVSENRLVVTMDKDFGELVYRSGMAHAGVLLLRMEAADGLGKLEVMKAIIENYLEEIKGCFAVYQQDKLRIRK
jgi:predicted nuclease of predicted toxin-antitoxin system